MDEFNYRSFMTKYKKYSRIPKSKIGGVAQTLRIIYILGSLFPAQYWNVNRLPNHSDGFAFTLSNQDRSKSGTEFISI